MKRSTRHGIAPDWVDTSAAAFADEVDELLGILGGLDIDIDDETEEELTRLYDSLRKRVKRFGYENQRVPNVLDDYQRAERQAEEMRMI